MSANPEPVTKQDIAGLQSEVQQLRSETKQDIATLRSETKQEAAMLRSEMQHTHDSLVERINDSETKLLDAFYGFAQSIQERHRSTDENESSMKKRLTIIEGRPTEVERRLNAPPKQ